VRHSLDDFSVFYIYKGTQERCSCRRWTAPPTQSVAASLDVFFCDVFETPSEFLAFVWQLMDSEGLFQHNLPAEMCHVVQVAPCMRRRRKQRWTEDEDRIAMRAFMQAMLLAGPRYEIRLLPWARLQGLHHSNSAATRRIAYYRSLKTTPSFAALTEVAVSVYNGRVAAARDALRTAVEDEMRGAKGVRPNSVPLEVSTLPEVLQTALPREALEAAMPREDFQNLPEGALFTPRTPAETAAHEELCQGLRKFLAAVPVTRAARIGGHKQKEDELELSLVCRPDGHRRRAAAAVLRGEVQVARVSGGAQASLGAEAEGVGWREAACAAHFFGLAVAAAASGAAAIIAAEAPHLLSANSRSCVADAITYLRKARVLVPDRSSPLRLALAKQAVSAAEGVVGVLSGEAAAGAATWLRAALARADASVQMPVDTRVSGALVAQTLASICGGSLQLDAVPLDESGRSKRDAAAGLEQDQFDNRCMWEVRISQATADGLHSTFMMQTHAFGRLAAAGAVTAAALGLPPESACEAAVHGGKEAGSQPRVGGMWPTAANSRTSKRNPSARDMSSAMSALGLHSVTTSSAPFCTATSVTWTRQKEVPAPESAHEKDFDSLFSRVTTALGEAISARGQEGLSVDDVAGGGVDMCGLRHALREVGEVASAGIYGDARRVSLLDGSAVDATSGLDDCLVRAGWQVRNPLLLRPRPRMSQSTAEHGQSGLIALQDV
jgi:hypothetical protein